MIINYIMVNLMYPPVVLARETLVVDLRRH